MKQCVFEHEYTKSWMLMDTGRKIAKWCNKPVCREVSQVNRIASIDAHQIRIKY